MILCSCVKLEHYVLRNFLIHARFKNCKRRESSIFAVSVFVVSKIASLKYILPWHESDPKRDRWIKPGRMSIFRARFNFACFIVRCTWQWHSHQQTHSSALITQSVLIWLPYCSQAYANICQIITIGRWT